MRPRDGARVGLVRPCHRFCSFNLTAAVRTFLSKSGWTFIKPRNAGYRGATVRVALDVDIVHCSATGDDSSLVGEGRPAIRRGLLNLLNAKFLFVCQAVGALIASFPLQLPTTTTDASARAVLSADAAAGQTFSLFRNQV